MAGTTQVLGMKQSRKPSGADHLVWSGESDGCMTIRGGDILHHWLPQTIPQAWLHLCAAWEQVRTTLVLGGIGRLGPPGIADFRVPR